MHTLSPRLFEELDQLSKQRLATRSLPAEVYVDEAILAAEKRSLFARGWVGLGRSDRCKVAGDYIAVNIADTEVAVIRGNDGHLRALSNSCLHRGTRLLEPGSGRTRSIVCPFHSWTYALDGVLKGAPGMRSNENFDIASCRLPTFRVAEHHGFMFVCLSDRTTNVNDWLDGFDPVHQPWPLADVATCRRREFEVHCNWKLFLDVFNEYYHLPTVHPNSINDAYGVPDSIDQVAGQFTTQFGRTNATASLLSRDRRQPGLPAMVIPDGRHEQGTRYTWCFPNMTFAASADCLWMFDVLPLGSSRTQVGMTICAPPQSMDMPNFGSVIERYYRRFDVAIEEDIEILLRQQAGVASRAASQGPFSTAEPSVARFASWYAENLTVN